MIPPSTNKSTPSPSFPSPNILAPYFTSIGVHVALCVILTLGVVLSFELFHAWVEKAWGQNAVYPVPLAAFLLAGLTMALASFYAAFPWFVVFAIGVRFSRAVWAYLWITLLLTVMGISSFTIVVATSWPGLEKIVQYGIVSWIRIPLNESLNAIVALSLLSPYHVKIQVTSFSDLAEMVNDQFFPILFLFFLGLIGPYAAKLFFHLRRRVTLALITALMFTLGAVEILFFDRSLKGLLLSSTTTLFVSYPHETMWACRANWVILLSAAMFGRITDVIYSIIHSDSLKKTRTDIRRPTL